MGGTITLLVAIIGLALELNYKNQLEVFRMTYRNNYMNENHNIKWTIAVYIKKHLSFRLGNALLNAFC